MDERSTREQLIDKHLEISKWLKKYVKEEVNEKMGDVLDE